MSLSPSPWPIKLAASLILLFLLAPILMLFVAALNPAPFFSFPPDALSLKWFKVFVTSREFQSSMRVSTLVALNAVAIGLFAGIPAAFALNRYDFGGKALVNRVLLSSLMLPRVVWAIALLQAFAALRMLGSPIGLVLAHSVLVLPYVVNMVSASLVLVPREVEHAAQSLGASPVRTFFEVTLPLVLPGAIVGAALGFVVSFTDVVVAVFISGSRYITFPVRVYSEQRGQGLDPAAIAGSAIVILVIVTLEIVGEKAFKWSRYM